MKPSDAIPEAIHWHEGMLLVPQHFQQAALRSEELLHYHLRALSPFPWGVRRLRIELREQLLQVSELEAVLPDGLRVVADAASDDRGQELTLDLGSYRTEMGTEPLTVHLAVPRRDGSLAHLRYRSVEGPEVADESTGDNPVGIPRRRPSASLVVTRPGAQLSVPLAYLPGRSASLPVPRLPERVPEAYVSIPLARVKRADPGFALVPFVPPQLQVTPGSELGEACAGLLRRARERALLLAERRRGYEAMGKREQAAELLPELRGIASELPALQAMLDAGAVHPFPLYLALCAFAGRLSALAPDPVPPVFRPYDHDDPQGSFQPVIDHALQLLREVRVSFTPIPFRQEEGCFDLALENRWAGRRLFVGALIPRGAQPEEVAAWMEESWIGSRSRMASIRERRVRGAPRRWIRDVPELGLVPGREVLLFRVEVDPEFIEPGQVLRIAHPPEHGGRTRPQSIILYAREG